MTMSTFAPEQLVAALNAADVAYVIVGGIAVAAHGVVRATADLDIVPDGRPENLDRLAGTLSELGAEHPIDGKLTGAARARPVSFELRTRHGDVQVLNRMPSVPPCAPLGENAIRLRRAPAAVATVCSLAGLRARNLAAGRPRDVPDLPELHE